MRSSICLCNIDFVHPRSILSRSELQPPKTTKTTSAHARNQLLQKQTTRASYAPETNVMTLMTQIVTL